MAVFALTNTFLSCTADEISETGTPTLQADDTGGGGGTVPPIKPPPPPIKP